MKKETVVVVRSNALKRSLTIVNHGGLSVSSSATYVISIGHLSDLSPPPFSGEIGAQATTCKLFT